MAIIGSLIVAISADTTQIKQQLAQLQANVAQLGGAGKTAQAGFSGLTGSIIQATTAMAGFASAAFAIRSLLQAGADLERIRATLTAMGGSVEAGAASFKLLQDQADKLGFNIVTLGEEFKNLMAAAQGTALAGEPIEKIFLQVTNASRALGSSSESTAQALKTIEGAMSRGTITSQQIYRGFQAIPGGLQILARSLSVTTDELRTMARNGELIADLILPRLGRQLELEWGSKASQTSNTAQTSLERMKNSWKELGDEIIKPGGIGEGLKGILGFVESALRGWTMIVRAARDYGDILAKIGAPRELPKELQEKPGGAGLPALAKTPEAIVYQQKLDAINEANQRRIVAAAHIRDIQSVQAAGEGPANLPEQLVQAKREQQQAEADVARLNQELTDAREKVDIRREIRSGLTTPTPEAAAASEAEAIHLKQLQEAIELQNTLTIKMKEYNDLRIRVEHELANDPENALEILKRGDAEAKKILVSISGIVAAFQRITPGTAETLPGLPNVQPEGKITAAQWQTAIPLLQAEATRRQVDPFLAAAVAIEESKLDPHAESRKHAKGIMQLMPGTATEMSVKDVFDTADNIAGGVKYLALRLKNAGGDVRQALAEWNWGPGNVATQGMGNLPTETRVFTERVLARAERMRGEAQGRPLAGMAMPTGVGAVAARPIPGGAPLLPGQEGPPSLGETVAGIGGVAKSSQEEITRGRAALRQQEETLANGLHYIKVLTDLQAAMDKLHDKEGETLAPQEEFNRFQRLTQVTEILKIQLAKTFKDPVLFQEFLAGMDLVIKAQQELIKQEMAEEAVRKTRERVNRATEGVTAGMIQGYQGIQHEFPQTNMALGQPGLGAQLGVRPADLQGVAGDFVLSQRLIQASQQIPMMVQLQATVVSAQHAMDLYKESIGAAGDISDVALLANDKEFQSLYAGIMQAQEALDQYVASARHLSDADVQRATAQFLQGLKDEYDQLILTNAELQKQKLQKLGTAPQDIALAEQMRFRNQVTGIASEGAGQIISSLQSAITTPNAFGPSGPVGQVASDAARRQQMQQDIATAQANLAGLQASVAQLGVGSPQWNQAQRAILDQQSALAKLQEDYKALGETIKQQGAQIESVWARIGKAITDFALKSVIDLGGVQKMLTNLLQSGLEKLFPSLAGLGGATDTASVSAATASAGTDFGSAAASAGAAFAAGGPVKAGGAVYLVAEEGMEHFVGVSGRVIALPGPAHLWAPPEAGFIVPSQARYGGARAMGGPVSPRMPDNFYSASSNVGTQTAVDGGTSGRAMGGRGQGSGNVYINVYAQDAGSFVRSQSEIQARMYRAWQQAQRNT